jgi:hypothetical protein
MLHSTYRLKDYRVQIRRYAALIYHWDSSMPESGRMTRSPLAAHQRRIKERIKVTRSSSPYSIFFYNQCLLMIKVTSTVGQVSKADRSLSFQKCFKFNLPRSNINSDPSPRQPTPRFPSNQL